MVRDLAQALDQAATVCTQVAAAQQRSLDLLLDAAVAMKKATAGLNSPLLNSTDEDLEQALAAFGGWLEVVGQLKSLTMRWMRL